MTLLVRFDENKLLDGVLYLHDITVNRMNGAPIKSYKLFRQLCGNKAMTHVIIVTTMWDAVSLENGERRMQELRDDYFDDALRHGVGVMRHYNTKQSADTIIAEVLNRSANLAPDALKIQREMVIDQKVIAATSAGQELLDQLDQATVKARNEPHDGEEEIKRIRRELEKIRAEQNALRRDLDVALSKNLRIVLTRVLHTRGKATNSVSRL